MSSVGGSAAADQSRAAGRGRVLDALHRAGEVCGVEQLAERTGLHPNTVRFHLSRLERDGLVAREARRTGQPGRPPAGYRPTPLPTALQGHRDFRDLAEVLAAIVSATASDPTGVAVDAGRGWGARTTGRQPAADAPAALAVLLERLREIGFAPETSAAGPRVTLRQHHCPFLEVARSHQAVVCSVHLGFMRGVLDQVGAPLSVEDLVPFSGPSSCDAHLLNRTAEAETPDFVRQRPHPQRSAADQ